MKRQWDQVYLESSAYVLPDEKITTSFIEEQLEEYYQLHQLPLGRLEFLTGIRSRYIWPSHTRSSDAVVKAGQLVFQDWATKQHQDQEVLRSQIDALIFASVSRDQLEPAMAARVHGELGLSPDCLFFDLSNACLGIIQAWMMAFDFLQSGKMKKILVVGFEQSRDVLFNTIEKIRKECPSRKEVKSLLANFTLGSGAYASLLTHKSYLNHDRYECSFFGGVYQADSSAHDLCVGGHGGKDHATMMQTQSELLLNRGLELAQKTWRSYRDYFHQRLISPELTITHQVGDVHSMKLYQSLELSRHTDISSYPEWGNIGPLSLPMTLKKALEEQHLIKKEILLMGIGSGLGCLFLGGHTP